MIRRQRRAESLHSDDEPNMIHGYSIPVNKLLLQHRPEARMDHFVRADVGKGFVSEII